MPLDRIASNLNFYILPCVLVFAFFLIHCHRIIVKPTRTTSQGNYNSKEQDEQGKTEVYRSTKDHFPSMPCMFLTMRSRPR